MRRQTQSKLVKTANTIYDNFETGLYEETLGPQEIEKQQLRDLFTHLALGVQQPLPDRADARKLMLGGLTLFPYKVRLSDAFPEYTPLQRTEIREALKEAGVRFDGDKVRGIRKQALATGQSKKWS